MGIGDWIPFWPKKAIEQKNSPVYAELGRSGGAGTRNTARRYVQYSSESYDINPIVYRCVNIKSTNLTSINWMLLEQNGDRIEDHPILDLLDNPNPNQTKLEFWEQVVLFLECGGGAPLHVVGANPKQLPILEGAAQANPNLVKELYTYRPDYIDIMTGRSGVPSQYEYNGTGSGRIIFPVDPLNGNSVMRVMKMPNSQGGDPFRFGTAPVQTVAYFVDLYNEAARWETKFLANDGRPQGYWKATDGVKYTAEQINQINKMIDEAWAGSEHAGKTKFVGNMEWHDAQTSVDKMKNREKMEFASRQIATGLNVQPQLLGIPGDSTYSNYEQALEAFWTQTMLPLGQRVAQTLNQWLVPMWDSSLTLTIDEDSITALESLRLAKWDKVENSSFLTANEKRHELNFPPLDDEEANELMIPANMVPMSMDSQEVKNLKAGLASKGYSTKAIEQFARTLAEEVELPEVKCEHQTLEDGEFVVQDDGNIGQIIDGKIVEL